MIKILKTETVAKIAASVHRTNIQVVNIAVNLLLAVGLTLYVMLGLCLIIAPFVFVARSVMESEFKYVIYAIASCLVLYIYILICNLMWNNSDKRGE